nr:immunoglobulin heavy chain junction region [Mus musculus]MBK4189060.1 immunoglobulin heavy chain junction region [Mus musculus]MBK4189061.1 immunoglobulin heavy chain junction region [Mus musculus]MBK4189062.1 immunoglobulin heavy chain junction region [Mus musculus]MBK4189063.1 immunoglobulin heavy chain junction region [Mus musculus]
CARSLRGYFDFW